MAATEHRDQQLATAVIAAWRADPFIRRSYGGDIVKLYASLSLPTVEQRHRLFGELRTVSRAIH